MNRVCEVIGTTIRVRFIRFISAWIYKYENTPLHDAVEAANEEEVLNLLVQGYRVSTKNLDRKTSLELAVGPQRQRIRKVLELYQRYTRFEDIYDAYLTMRDKLKMLNLTKYLFEIVWHNPRVDFVKYEKYTPLQIIICLLPQKVNLISEMLEMGCDPFVVDRRKNNILHLIAAVAPHKTPVVCRKLLALRFIEVGVNLNAKNYEGNTPLHITLQKRTSLESLLLKSKANVLIANGSGKTPFHEALLLEDTTLMTLVVKNLVLAKHRGQGIPDSILNQIEGDSHLDKKYKRFESCLGVLQNTKIVPQHPFTYHDLLTKRRNPVFRVLGSEAIIYAYDNRTEIFQSYETDVHHAIREATRIMRVREMAFEILQDTFGNNLSYHSMVEITRYFRGNDVFLLERIMESRGLDLSDNQNQSGE